MSNLSDDFSHIIVAQATPKGSGAIALLRCSGAGIRTLLSRVFIPASKKDIMSVASHTVHYGTIVDNNQRCIDEVLAIIMDAPRTFNGDDTVEITCHNNQCIVEAILQCFMFYGARIALPGEFTKRAVLNNKIDLLQAESIHELITAQSLHNAQHSLATLQGTFSHIVKEIEKKLISFSAFCNASFEFIEEDSLSFIPEMKRIITSIKESMESCLASYHAQRIMREGVVIALIGKTNAGKSSLFNALLSSDRAIVSNVPGTTRDTIEGTFFHEGIAFTLIDTAGIRKSSNAIENEGIARTYAAMKRADTILFIEEEGTGKKNNVLQKFVREHYSHKTWYIQSKMDKKTEGATSTDTHYDYSVSLSDVASIRSLKNGLIAHHTPEKIFTEGTYALNQRQSAIIHNSFQEIKKIEMYLSLSNPPYELIAYHSNEAQKIIGQLQGDGMTKEVFDAIFENFCVGK